MVLVFYNKLQCGNRLTLRLSATAAGITPGSIYEVNDKEVLSSLNRDIVIWGHARHSLGLLWSGTCVQSWDKLSLTPTAADTSPPHGRHEGSPFTSPPLLQQKSNLAKSTSKAKEMVHSHISVIQQQVAVPYTCWVNGDMGPFSCLSPSDRPESLFKLRTLDAFQIPCPLAYSIRMVPMVRIHRWLATVTA